MNIRQIIEYAKRILDEDPHLANYMLRDTAEVRDAGLADLSWAMHREGVAKGDVIFLIEQLEKYLLDTEQVLQFP